MSRRIITRRQLLHGVGGFTLGLPFLPSLLPRTASAQEATFRAPKRFFCMATNHGAVFEDAMFPSEDLFTETQTLYPGLDIRRGDLRRTVSGDQASVAPVLSARQDELTENLVRKMNVLRGIDVPFYIAHHTGGHLGNYARNDGNGGQGQSVQGLPMPTIDQVLAWSDKFYPDLGAVTQRSLHCGSGRMSYGFSSPQSRSGGIQEIPSSGDAAALFDRVFPNPIVADSNAQAPRTPVVDRVLQAYNRLRQSNQRMSTADRQRLDAHMDQLSELERRLTTRPSASCSSPARPGGYSNQFERYQQMADVIAAAFICGSSRIAVMGVTEEYLTPYGGNWHQDVAHQWQADSSQKLLQDVNRAAFREILVALATRLEVEEAPGETVLDNSLLFWTQESGMETHESRSVPIVTFGGAGGAMRTGQVVDYRRRTPEGMVKVYNIEQGYSGLTYNQYMATCMRAMGLTPADWRHVPNIGAAGYCVDFVEAKFSATHVPGVMANADDFLPLLSA